MPRPRTSAGRVYCGYSSSSGPGSSVSRGPENDSSCGDAALPITPGTCRVTASITTAAATSPPNTT